MPKKFQKFSKFIVLSCPNIDLSPEYFVHYLFTLLEENIV